MGLQKLTCAELLVESLEEEVRFTTEVLGLTELTRDGGRVYLTCGADGESPQLVLREGGTGVSVLTFGVDSEEDLTSLTSRLRGIGVEVHSRTDAAPDQIAAVVFSLPTRQQVELVARPERPLFPHPAFDVTARRRGVAPSDIDHVTIAFADDASGQATAAILTDGLGFAVSDIILDADDKWMAAWTRAGQLHHDIGLIRCQPGATLHHLAWTVDGADHHKTAADALAHAGYGLETGPGRHGVGGNLYSYFWTPGGNRYELSAEMTRVAGDRREPLVRYAATFNSFSAWGIPRPDSFTQGS